MSAQAMKLIPGAEWNPLDSYVEPLPLQWSGAYAGAKLIEAFDTLSRLPEVKAPKGYATVWVPFVQELDDEDRARLEADLAERQHKTIVRPSAPEIAQADQALCWAPTYLTGDECRIVQAVAFHRALGKDLDYCAQRLLRQMSHKGRGTARWR